MPRKTSFPRVILKNENCLDFLPTLAKSSADLIIIDPPYEISHSTNFRSGLATGTNRDRFRVTMDFGEWDGFFYGLDIVINECYRILKKAGTLICFYDIWKITQLKDYFDKANFKQIRFIEWIKANPVPINSKVNYLTNAREAALTGVKICKPTFHSDYDKGLYIYPICHAKERLHPTQKPEALIEELILKHSNPKETILDCFSGSGTTAVCSIRNNRNFVGCEIDPLFYQSSLQRIRAEKDKLKITITLNRTKLLSSVKSSDPKKNKSITTNNLKSNAKELFENIPEAKPKNKAHAKPKAKASRKKVKPENIWKTKLKKFLAK